MRIGPAMALQNGVACARRGLSAAALGDHGCSSTCRRGRRGTLRFSGLYSRRNLSSSDTSRESQQQSQKQASKADLEHCVDLVQQRDREGYLCGLLMPSRNHARDSYFAIRALNVELASIKDGTSERRHQQQPSQTGVGTSEVGSSLALRMRMQWWRDALDELYPSTQTAKQQPSVAGFLASTASSCWNNPVVRVLHESVEASNLTKRFLTRLLDARDADLDISQMATLADAKQYAEDTYSSLLYLSLECANVRQEAADTVAFHAGVGLGLTIALRSTVHRAGSGEMAIPADLFGRPIPSQYLMGRHDPELEVNPEYEDILREAVHFMAYEASQELVRARELQKEVPKVGKACLLPVVPAMHFLSVLKEADYDLWEAGRTAENSRLLVMARLGRAWFSGRI